MTDPTPVAPLDLLAKMIKGEVPPPPVARLVGFRLVEVGRERAVFEMDADERHANPMGTLHGGIVCDLADAALGTAFATTLEAGQSYTTLELSINFLKPVWKARLRATGKVVKRTKRTGLTEVEVRDESGSLVAWGKSTCLVLQGEEAAGR
jgi:uncharacterized protein (TIGR00369 family)